MKVYLVYLIILYNIFIYMERYFKKIIIHSTQIIILSIKSSFLCNDRNFMYEKCTP